jgi:hypothetical protein
MSAPFRNNVSSARSPRATPPWLRVLQACLRAQWIVGGTCAVAAIAYPQVEVYGCVLGAFLNAFIAKLLKRVIKQQRPMFRPSLAATATKSKQQASSDALADTSDGVVAAAGALVQEAASEVAASAVDTALFAADTFGVSHPPPEPLLAALPHPQLSEKHLGHGMPSSHAMSLFYFATYLTLAVYDSRNWQPVINSAGVPQPPHPFVVLLQTHLPAWLLHSWTHGWARPTIVAVLYTLVSLECWTRIRRRLHSPAQIGVGALLGAVVAFLHAHVLMPVVREQSKDVPPLAERSAQFKIVLVACMTIMAALTLERNTQRIAKRMLGGLFGSLQRGTGNTTKAKPVRNAQSRPNGN